MTFAQRIETATQSAYATAAPWTPSPVEIEDAIQPVVAELLEMPQKQAWDYIRASFSHIGHQALAVRMFKGQFV